VVEPNWRTVEGFPNYLVSTTGRVKWRDGRGKTLQTHKLGYRTTTLYHIGQPTVKYVHRLVAEAFLPRKLGKEVNHKDGDKANNNLDNLEWVTSSENQLHATRVLLKGIGSKNGYSKLKEEQVLDIKNMLESGMSQTTIGNIFNVSNHAIHRISKGYNWGWLTGYVKEDAKTCLTD